MYAPPWPGQRRPRPAPDASNAFVRFWPRTLDTSGAPYLPWADDRPWDPASVPKTAAGQTISTSVWSGREHIRVRSLPLYYEGKVIGVMQIASSLENMDQALTSLTITM